MDFQLEKDDLFRASIFIFPIPTVIHLFEWAIRCFVFVIQLFFRPIFVWLTPKIVWSWWLSAL